MRKGKNKKSISKISKEALDSNISKETKGNNCVSNTEVILDEAEDKKGIGKFIHDYQTVLVFAIPALVSIPLVLFNFLRYFYVLGKFDYWGISRVNIVVFDSVWILLSLGLVCIIILCITSIFFFDWKENSLDSNHSIVISNKFIDDIKIALGTFLFISPIISIMFSNLQIASLFIFVPWGILFIFIFVEYRFLKEDPETDGDKFQVRDKNLFRKSISACGDIIAVLFISIWIMYILFEVNVDICKLLFNVVGLLLFSLVIFILCRCVLLYPKWITEIPQVDESNKNNPRKSPSNMVEVDLKRIVLEALFVSILFEIAYIVSLFFVYMFFGFFWLIFLEHNFDQILLKGKEFFDLMSRSIFQEYGVFFVIIPIICCLFLNVGMRWILQAFFRVWSIHIEDHVSKITKKKKWQNIIPAVVLMGFIFIIPYIFGYSDATIKTDFLVIQNLSRSVDSPAPNWIVLHEDKDSYIVAEYDDYIKKDTSSNKSKQKEEDKHIVNIYYEVQTVVKKEGVTVYQKSFEKVERKEGAKRRGVSLGSASS